MCLCLCLVYALNALEGDGISREIGTMFARHLDIGKHRAIVANISPKTPSTHLDDVLYVRNCLMSPQCFLRYNYSRMVNVDSRTDCNICWITFGTSRNVTNYGSRVLYLLQKQNTWEHLSNIVCESRYLLKFEETAPCVPIISKLSRTLHA